MTLDNVIETAGFLLGLAYLYYEFKASPRMWLIGLIMPMVSMWIYYSRGLYADFAMNIYYLVMAIYGYIVWTFNLRRRVKATLPVTHISLSSLVLTTIVFAVVYAAIAAWLVFLTDSNVPYWDAFTTAMSIIGTWMLARKYLEQWLAWFMVDAVCVGLYIYKGIYLYAALYCAYTILAVFGYLRWRRMMRSDRG